MTATNLVTIYVTSEQFKSRVMNKFLEMSGYDAKILDNGLPKMTDKSITYNKMNKWKYLI